MVIALLINEDVRGVRHAIRGCRCKQELYRCMHVQHRSNKMSVELCCTLTALPAQVKLPGEHGFQKHDNQQVLLHHNDNLIWLGSCLSLAAPDRHLSAAPGT